MKDYVELKHAKIISKDNYNFFLPIYVAEISPKLSEMIREYKIHNTNETIFEVKLNFSREVLRVIVDFLNYKYFSENDNNKFKIVNNFDFSSELSIDVLICSSDLGL